MVTSHIMQSVNSSALEYIVEHCAAAEQSSAAAAAATK